MPRTSLTRNEKDLKQIQKGEMDLVSFWNGKKQERWLIHNKLSKAEDKVEG